MPGTSPVTFALEVTDPSPHALEQLRQDVLAQLAPWPGLDADARRRYALELVLEEWLTNAFRHGAATWQRLRVEAAPDGQGLLLEFVDDGRPFDPTRQHAAPRPASLDEAEPGGLGLLLIGRHVRRWEHDRQGPHNRLRAWL